jgi:diguanylate cyclase (GGDEF)-like protein
MKLSKFIPKTYHVILVICCILCLIGAFFVPTKEYKKSDTSAGSKIEPVRCKQIDHMTREFYFTDIDWNSGASCLRFSTTHQEAQVTADGKLLYERKVNQTTFGRTTGWGWEFVEIPEGTKEVMVKITATYDGTTDINMTFYKGDCYAMYYSLIKGSLFSIIICAINIILGIAMIIYWIFMYRRSKIGNEVISLGIFAVLWGIWSALETNFAQLLFINREAWSFVSPVMMMLMSVPFMLFFHDYLEDKNPYLCPSLIKLSLIQIIVVMFLNFTKIAYVRETILSTQLMMALSVAYYFITLGHTYKEKGISMRVKVSLVGSIALGGAFFMDMIAYNSHMSDSDTFGRLGFLVFFLSLGGSSAVNTLREAKAGQEAMIYKELAEKDMLTGCYNRNAYLNDTGPDNLKDGLLLVTFDLNNLKYYNDTFGHACGDQYLCDAVSIMQQVFGPLGKLYRIGGDEFTVLIPPENPCEMEHVLVDFVLKEQAYNKTSELINLQVACGYARYQAEQDFDLEETRERADILMYKNKKELKGGYSYR